MCDVRDIGLSRCWREARQLPHIRRILTVCWEPFAELVLEPCFLRLEMLKWRIPFRTAHTRRRGRNCSSPAAGDVAVCCCYCFRRLRSTAKPPIARNDSVAGSGVQIVSTTIWSMIVPAGTSMTMSSNSGFGLMLSP